MSGSNESKRWFLLMVAIIVCLAFVVVAHIA